MNQAVLPLVQPTNNIEIQKKTSSASEANGSNFLDMFDNAVQKQSNEVSQKEGTANDSTNKESVNDISEKRTEVINASSNQTKMDKTSKVKDSGFEINETVSAREFLEKLGIDIAEIQKILQINGLSENATLLELLNSVNLSIDNLEKFLETSAIDFLNKFGIEDEKIEEIVQLIADQGEKSQTVISVKNLFEYTGLSSEKHTAVEAKDFSVESFFQKLGLNEKETSNFVKELVAGNPLNDKAVFNLQETNAKDLLKQMGLNSNEITKVIEKSIKNSNEKDKIKNLILNKDFSALKKLVSPEKFNINLSGKPDFKVQSEMILPTNPVSDSSPVSSLQSSGSMNGTNVGSGSNGYAQLTNISNEIPTDSRLHEAAPKAFFERTVIDQIVSKVSFRVTNGQEEIKVRLEPPSLGSLKLKVSVEGKTVNATIVADNSITKEIIQSNIQQLKNSMAEQGLKLDNISVLVGDGQSRDRDMDEFRMLLTKENMEQNAEMEDENNSNLIEQNSRYFYRAGYAFSQSGVDLFI